MFPTFLTNSKWCKGKSSFLTLSKKTKVSLIDKTLFGKQLLESLPMTYPEKLIIRNWGKLPYRICNKRFLNLGPEFPSFTHLDKKVRARPLGWD
jgi:hypothetical protein